jgi:hypothetical protein
VTQDTIPEGSAEKDSGSSTVSVEPSATRAPITAVPILPIPESAVVPAAVASQGISTPVDGGTAVGTGVGTPAVDPFVYLPVCMDDGEPLWRRIATILMAEGLEVRICGPRVRPACMGVSQAVLVCVHSSASALFVASLDAFTPPPRTAVCCTRHTAALDGYTVSSPVSLVFIIVVAVGVVQLLERLCKFGETVERRSLLGSAYKRRAWAGLGDSRKEDLKVASLSACTVVVVRSPAHLCRVML